MITLRALSVNRLNMVVGLQKSDGLGIAAKTERLDTAISAEKCMLKVVKLYCILANTPYFTRIYFISTFQSYVIVLITATHLSARSPVQANKGSPVPSPDPL